MVRCSRVARTLCALLALALTAAPLAAQQEQPLRLLAPVFASNKSGSKLKPLVTNKPFEVTVRLYTDSEGTPRLDAESQAWEETFTVAPGQLTEVTDLAAGHVVMPSKVSSLVPLPLGATLVLPDDLLSTQLWFTTQIATVNKKGIVTTHAESPPQPLALSGFVHLADGPEPSNNGNPGGAHWVAERRNGAFVIELEHPAARNWSSGTS